MSANKKEDFKKHIRKYINLYLLNCLFEVLKTTRYSLIPEAVLKARKDIERSEIIYLYKTQASFIKEEAFD